MRVPDAFAWRDLPGVSQPWHRQTNEPLHWFKRFEIYRHIPRYDRTVRLTCEIDTREANKQRAEMGIPLEKITPSKIRSFYEASRKYDWESRAEAFDKFEIHRENQEFERRRHQSRMERVNLLRKYLGKVDRAMDYLSPDQFRASDVTGALKVVVEGLRAEFVDDPKRIQINPDQSPIDLSKLSDADLSALASLISRLSGEE